MQIFCGCTSIAILKHYFRIKKINQIPREEVVTTKDLFLHTIQAVFGAPIWFPMSFDIPRQLLELIGEFKLRQVNGEDTTFIIKPPTLARGIGHTITNNLDCILRLLETGDKVASKYIEQPALFNYLKYDLRFMVVVKQTDPIEVYVYETFLTRFANKRYSMHNFEEYDKHFTVMTFTPMPLKEVLHKDFIIEFEKRNLTLKWSDIQHKINEIIRNSFAAGMMLPNAGFIQSENYFGLYGVDIILNESLQPILLEINYCPNCNRLVNYNPYFWNEVFALLFLHQAPENRWNRVL